MPSCHLRRSVAAALAALLLPGCAARRAYDGTIVTDRPDFTESAVAVPRRAVQVEAGNTYARTDGVRANVAGEALVRLGVRRGAELRLLVPSYVSVDEPGGPRGLGDAGVGVKLELLAPREDPGYVPAVAVIVGTGLPTGARAFRTRGLSPEAKLALGFTPSERWGVSSNLNVSSADAGDGRAGELGGSLSLGRTLGARAAAYLEWFGSRVQDAGSANYANTGLTWLLSPNDQLDVRVGRGLGATRDDWFVGLGVSRRW